MCGCSLEVFDEDNKHVEHMRVNRVDVKWLEGRYDTASFRLLTPSTGLVSISR